MEYRQKHRCAGDTRKLKYFLTQQNSNQNSYHGVMEWCIIDNYMNNKSNWLGPVAIGGVGGSGTRVIAEILIQLGFYLGKDMNPARDNLWFTLLFKRPDWFFKKVTRKESHIMKGLSIFEKAMTAHGKPHSEELSFIMRAVVEMMFKGHDYSGSGRGLWPIRRAVTMFHSKKINRLKYLGWGWKEPNTHIYLEYLNNHFHRLKYIHLMRHGIDMAYSRNQSQLYNWGRMFGIAVNDSSIPLPRLSLQYWNEANRKAITLGRKHLKERFLVINFDKLCTDPRHEIELLIHFLGLDTRCVNMDELERLPRLPESAGRYRKYDLSIFGKEEIEAVRELGFIVDI